MKIHTTQNLSPLNATQPTSISMPKGKNLKHLETSYFSEKLNSKQNNSISFEGKKDLIKTFEEFMKAANGGKGKKPNRGFFDEMLDSVKKATSKMMTPVKEAGKKALESPKFDKLLDAMGNEVLVQAGIALVICAGLRPLTILALPDKGKDKNDNIYAAGHSICSGIMGFVAPLLLVTPFVNGSKQAMEQYYKHFNEETLERLWPNLDIKSIRNKAGEMVSHKEWKDKLGNPWSKDYKDFMTIAKPKHISQVSEETLKAIGVDVDLKAMKDVPIEKWVDRAGKPVELPLNEAIIAVQEEGMGTNFFSLQHIDKNFLQEVFPKLDMATVEKGGERLHYKHWKNVDGSAVQLNPESFFISSYRETNDAIPLITGKTRIDTLDKNKVKYSTYQRNIKDLNPDGTEVLGTPSKLGSEIDQKYLEADAVNTIMNKIIVWLPDIVTRYFVASATIKLLPFVLKNVFGLEKTAKKQARLQAEQQSQQVQNNIEADKKEPVSTSGKEVA